MNPHFRLRASLIQKSLPKLYNTDSSYHLSYGYYLMVILQQILILIIINTLKFFQKFFLNSMALALVTRQTIY